VRSTHARDAAWAPRRRAAATGRAWGRAASRPPVWLGAAPTAAVLPSSSTMRTCRPPPALRATPAVAVGVHAPRPLACRPRIPLIPLRAVRADQATETAIDAATLDAIAAVTGAADAAVEAAVAAAAADAARVAALPPVASELRAKVLASVRDVQAGLLERETEVRGKGRRRARGERRGGRRRRMPDPFSFPGPPPAPRRPGRRAPAPPRPPRHRQIGAVAAAGRAHGREIFRAPAHALLRARRTFWPPLHGGPGIRPVRAADGGVPADGGGRVHRRNLQSRARVGGSGF